MMSSELVFGCYDETIGEVGSGTSAYGYEHEAIPDDTITWGAFEDVWSTAQGKGEGIRKARSFEKD
jgi:hypothetical protein